MQNCLVFSGLNESQEKKVHLLNHKKNERILQIYDVDINETLSEFKINEELIDARSMIIQNPDIL